MKVKALILLSLVIFCSKQEPIVEPEEEDFTIKDYERACAVYHTPNHRSRFVRLDGNQIVCEPIMVWSSEEQNMVHLRFSNDPYHEEVVEEK